MTIFLDLKDYQPKAYDALPEFYAARGGAETISQQVNAFGSIICKYRYQDVIGLTLLHQHFPIDHTDVLTRRISPPFNATMRPEDRSHHNDQTLVPYLWMYCDIEDTLAWYPVEFVITDKYPVSEIELLRYADPLLKELGDELVSKGLNKALGIAGMHGRHGLRLEDNETLLENTDEENKILDLSVTRIGTFDVADTTQTFWTFTPVEEPDRMERDYVLQ